jgi:MFS family permease
MADELATTTDAAIRAPMERNLRLLGWWWWSRWFWLGEGIFVVFLLEEHGITVGQVLLFEAVWAATVLLVEVPSGILADRFGRKRLLLFAGVVSIAGFLFFGLGAGLLVLVGYIGFGMADATYSGADSALLFDTLEPLERTDEFEPRLGRLNGLIMAGFAGMTIAGSLMVEWTSLRFPILLSAALTAPSLLIMWRVTEPRARGGQASIRAIGGAAIARLFTSRSMWSVVLFQVVVTEAIILMATLQQPVLLAHGAPIWSLGIFIAAQMLLGAAGSWLAGPVSERLGLHVLFIVVPLASALSLLAGASDMPWTYALFVFPAAGFHLIFPHASGFLARRVTERERATVISLASMFASATSVAVTPLLGLLVDRRGLDTAFIVAGLSFAALSLVAYLAWVTSGDTSRDPAEPPTSDDLGMFDLPLRSSTSEVADTEGTP